MVLLPSGSFEAHEWDKVISHSDISTHRDQLWKCILDGIGRKEGKGLLTHLAVNSGIPLHKDSDAGEDESGENILRTPSGLVMLHGDFGPALSPDEKPSDEDFEKAFWVSTKQNGITQAWAPRYTMFSRGNVKEKARLLDFHSSTSLKLRRMGKSDVVKSTAIDLYAGIGYFVFCYVKMGMARVIGWELNPWSVEGLRRGAISNGWSIKVLNAGENLEIGSEKIIIVLEDNREAMRRLGRIASEELGIVRHVNCGLLPTSEMSWEMALGLLSGVGWLHLHENVGVQEIPARRIAIEEQFWGWLDKLGDSRYLTVEHVELVKTFAPGVWHCVFDVYVDGNNSTT